MLLSGPRPYPQHDPDDDCGCIHCGLDLVDVPQGEPMPPCTVDSASRRLLNWQAYRSEQRDLED